MADPNESQQQHAQISEAANLNQRNGQASTRKKMSRSDHDDIRERIYNLMQEFNAKGFVFGIISENGKPITGASMNLCSWWKLDVHFEKNAREVIIKYVNKNKSNTILDTARRINDTFTDATLSIFLSTMMKRCEPSSGMYPLASGVSPPWWPTGDEEWWSQLGVAEKDCPPPYKKPHDLKKPMKVGVMMSIIKHMSPDIGKIQHFIEHSQRLQDKMTNKEKQSLFEILEQEKALSVANNGNSFESSFEDHHVVATPQDVNSRKRPYFNI
ncbi:ETHYLENE INSENSITIVE 3-like 1 protein [Rutidosis leptorrhynchoides]|uniref:ETHYLENE INSENSITIVE 3-like 1 protein n=1 Tax=Rutidosis leptorrhynchoides TaxID=125765 RepID=UPI003A999F24